MAFDPAEPRDKQGKWYHGTYLAGLKPGDLIEPGHQKNWGYSDPQHISISSNPHGALGYGDVAAYRHGKGLRAGHVYEVAPTGPVGQDKNSIGRGDEKENRQTTGARVVRELSPAEALTIRWQQHGWGDPPADLLKEAGPIKEAELSSQIEMAYDPAEPRDTAGKWFRGTRDTHQPGDMIAPQSGVSFAISDPDEARQYARTARGLGVPKVYEVEPTGQNTSTVPAYHRSGHPLRVVRQVWSADTELSNDGHCTNCGCPRPDSISGQIELARLDEDHSMADTSSAL